MFVFQGTEAHVDTSREQPDKEIKVEKERWPSCRLMLGDRSYDGNVNLGITRIPKGIETTSPGSDDSGRRQKHKPSHRHSEDN